MRRRRLLAEACLSLVETIDATGGCVRLESGELVPAGDRDWPDLARAYVDACRALQHAPIVRGHDEMPA